MASASRSWDAHVIPWHSESPSSAVTTATPVREIAHHAPVLEVQRGPSLAAGYSIG